MRTACGAILLFAVQVAGASLDPAMNGTYRCENGVVFTATVKASPTVSTSMEMVGPGQKSASAKAVAGAHHTTHTLGGPEFYGVHVRYDGKKHKLYPVDGKPNLYTDNQGRFSWTLADGTAPYAGTIAGPEATLGSNCRLETVAGKQ